MSLTAGAATLDGMKLRTPLFAAFRDAQRAQRILFDDHIRLDRVADPTDLPHVPLTWRRTLTGWELAGTVLPGDDRSSCGHPC